MNAIERQLYYERLEFQNTFLIEENERLQTEVKTKSVIAQRAQDELFQKNQALEKDNRRLKEHLRQMKNYLECIESNVSNVVQDITHILEDK